jgi:hypothetical protein
MGLHPFLPASRAQLAKYLSEENLLRTNTIEKNETYSMVRKLPTSLNGPRDTETKER